MNCLVVITSYKEPCMTIVVQGEFDETINAYGETNVITIDKDPDDATIALVI